MNRRGFLTGLGALMAAPAIVHAGNLMPIKVMVPTTELYGRGPMMEIVQELRKLKTLQFGNDTAYVLDRLTLSHVTGLKSWHGIPIVERDRLL